MLVSVHMIGALPSNMHTHIGVRPLHGYVYVMRVPPCSVHRDDVGVVHLRVQEDLTADLVLQHLIHEDTLVALESVGVFELFRLAMVHESAVIPSPKPQNTVQ